MTNRKDLLDEALLRPGRLEVQVEISLPDENGRLQILQIHTNKLKESSFLSPDVNLQELAARTKNYSGAELEGVVKSAVSYALNRQLSMDDLTKPVDEESIRVTMDDFLNALQEVIPTFGASTDDLERCRGDWKEIEFKEYNFLAKGKPTEGGCLHPLLKVEKDSMFGMLEG